MCRATVVFPLDSGPYTSIILPLGTPPRPRARSRLRQPVGVVSICILAPLSPSFMTEPFPNCFSICPSAASNARIFSSFTIIFSLSFYQTSVRECLFAFYSSYYYIFLLLSSKIVGKSANCREPVFSVLIITPDAAAAQEVYKTLRFRIYSAFAKI